MNMVSQDLYRTIIEFVPIVDLRTLSKASAVFDTEICKMGIKIFYDKGLWYHLDHNDIIIQLTSGKKYMLRSYANSNMYNILGTSCAVGNENIRYGPKESDTDIIYYDNKSRIATFSSINYINILQDCDPTKAHRFANISIGLDRPFNYIDFNTSIAMYRMRMATWITIMFEEFTVLFRNGQWTRR